MTEINGYSIDKSEVEAVSPIFMEYQYRNQVNKYKYYFKVYLKSGSIIVLDSFVKKELEMERKKLIKTNDTNNNKN